MKLLGFILGFVILPANVFAAQMKGGMTPSAARNCAEASKQFMNTLRSDSSPAAKSVQKAKESRSVSR